MIRARTWFPVVLPLAAVGAGLLISGPAGASLTAASGASATATCTKAISDAKSATWVHEVVTATSGNKHLTEIGDLGPAEGRQSIKIGRAQAQVVLVGQTAYVTANKAGFETYLDLTKGKAGRWYSITKSSSYFSTVTAALTTRSDFSELDFVGPCTGGTTQKLNGQTVVALVGHIISGSSHTAATLYVSTGSKPLPVGLTASADGTTEHATWSDWGTSVSLHKPSNVRSISSIQS